MPKVILFTKTQFFCEYDHFKGQTISQTDKSYIIKMGAILIPYFLEQWPFFNVYTDNEILYNLIF